jgi:hypothetical protein
MESKSFFDKTNKKKSGHCNKNQKVKRCKFEKWTGKHGHTLVFSF